MAYKKTYCRKSFDGKHIFASGEIYRETFPFGFRFLSRMKLIRIVLRCHACGLTANPTKESMKKLGLTRKKGR
jgi:hypothetical protein